MYHSSVPQFSNHNVLEIILKDFRGTKLILSRCNFSNITEANYKQAIGQDWKCYQSLQHFELTHATCLKQFVLNQIADNLAKAVNLKVLRFRVLSQI